jgi:hypothetical protein
MSTSISSPPQKTCNHETERCKVTYSLAIENKLESSISFFVFLSYAPDIRESDQEAFPKIIQRLRCALRKRAPKENFSPVKEIVCVINSSLVHPQPVEGNPRSRNKKQKRREEKSSRPSH